MHERVDQQETRPISEPEGLPLDLYSDPAKYDGEIPMWKRTVGFIRQYEKSKPKGKDALLEQLAAATLRDLSTLGYLIDNFSLASQIRPDLNFGAITDGFVGHLERSASKRSSLPGWTPGKIEELVKLGLDASGKLVDSIERIKISIFNAPKSPGEAVYLQYNTAWAMVSTTDNRVREELFSILCLEKSWFRPESLASFYFTMGSSFPDDQTCERYHAVIETLKPVGFLLETKGEVVPIFPQRLQSRDLRLLGAQASISETEQIAREKIVLSYIAQNPKRWAGYKAYVESRAQDTITDLLQPKSPFETFEGVDFMEERRKNKEAKIKAENYSWPASTIFSTREPLTVFVRKVFIPRVYRTFWESYQRVAQGRGFEKLTDTPIQLTDDVELDIIAKGALTTEQKQEIVRDVYTAVLREDSQVLSLKAAQSFAGVVDVAKASSSVVCPFDKAKDIRFNISLRLPEEEIGRLSSILEYHRPIFTVEQIQVIENQIDNIRQDLLKGFTKSIGRRGYTLVVSDLFLRRLGYEGITVNQATTSNRIHVRMVIDGEEYRFDLNGDYRMSLGQDLKQIKSAQDKVWLEILVLSHLKKLLCTEEEEDRLKAELVGGERQYERYRKQIGRREHLRRQAPINSAGNRAGYSTRAFELCLKSGLPVKNLYLINRMKAEIGKGGTKETGIWTYVSGTEYVDAPDAQPVKIAFKNASEDIRQVVTLGEVSAEELARVEEEILGELRI